MLETLLIKRGGGGVVMVDVGAWERVFEHHLKHLNAANFKDEIIWREIIMAEI